MNRHELIFSEHLVTFYSIFRQLNNLDKALRKEFKLRKKKFHGRKSRMNMERKETSFAMWKQIKEKKKTENFFNETM